MKRLIVLFLFVSTSLFAQTAPWTGWESQALSDSFATRDDSLAALRADYNTLTTGTMKPLANTYMYVGSSLGNAVAYPITGAWSITNTGVTSINSDYITNSMIKSTARIDPSKIGTTGSYTIDDNEYYALDGLSANIQEQINDINFGTGYILNTGDEMEGNLDFADGIKLRLGNSQDLQTYHSGSYAYFDNTTGQMIIRNVADAKMSFYTNNTERWYYSGGGHLLPFLTDTYNIGSTLTQPDTVYAGTFYSNGVDIGTVLGTHSTTSAINSLISDSLLNRQLDPIVFATGSPQTGDVLGPFRIHRDITITSEYLYIAGGTSVTYNVFYHTSVNTDAVAGSGSETPLFISDEVGTPTSGVQVDSDDSNIYEAVPDEGDWIWCKIVLVSGSPTRFSLTLNKSGR